MVFLGSQHTSKIDQNESKSVKKEKKRAEKREKEAEKRKKCARERLGSALGAPWGDFLRFLGSLEKVRWSAWLDFGLLADLEF